MQAPVRVGEIVAGKYEVERVLAHGGVGVVVKARHVQLGEPCAIKLLLPDALETPMIRERFLREARACARLKSDHVVKVFDVGELDDGSPYMVLEYLEGIDLEERMERGRMPVGEAALYVLQICAALAEAHALGIVHRDIKPGNIFLVKRADGTTRVKLLDFGISKVLNDTPSPDQAQTMEGTVMGTPVFMAPEQARGEAVDARTDVWAVGVLLYHLLTGFFPFEGSAPFKTLDKILNAEPTPPSELAPGIPPEVDAIVLHCLRKIPSQRPAGVHELAAALERFAAEGAPISLHVRRIHQSLSDGRSSLLPAASTPVPPSQAPPVTLEDGPRSTSPQTAPARSRRPLAIGAVAAGLLLVVAAGVRLSPRAPAAGAARIAAGEAPTPAPPASSPAPAETGSPVIAPPAATADAGAPTLASGSTGPSKPPRMPPAPVRRSEPASQGFDLGSRR